MGFSFFAAFAVFNDDPVIFDGDDIGTTCDADFKFVTKYFDGVGVFDGDLMFLILEFYGSLNEHFVVIGAVVIAR